MKKLISILLCLALSLGTGLALAETVKLEDQSRLYDFTVELPDGMVHYHSILEGEYSGTVLRMAEDFVATLYEFAVYHDEQFDDKSFAIMTEEELTELYFEFAEALFNPTWAENVTESGIPYMFISNEDGTEFIYVTLINGYVVSLDVYNEDFATLTPGELYVAEALFNSLQHIDEPAFL